jgi:hypothetical protein
MIGLLSAGIGVGWWKVNNSERIVKKWRVFFLFSMIRWSERLHRPMRAAGSFDETKKDPADLRVRVYASEFLRPGSRRKKGDHGSGVMLRAECPFHALVLN